MRDQHYAIRQASIRGVRSVVVSGRIDTPNHLGRMVPGPAFQRGNTT